MTQPLGNKLLLKLKLYVLLVISKTNFMCYMFLHPKPLRKMGEVNKNGLTPPQQFSDIKLQTKKPYYLVY